MTGDVAARAAEVNFLLGRGTRRARWRQTPRRGAGKGRVRRRRGGTVTRPPKKTLGRRWPCRALNPPGQRRGSRRDRTARGRTPQVERHGGAGTGAARPTHSLPFLL